MKNLNALITTIVLFSLPVINAQASLYAVTDLGSFFPRAFNGTGQILGSIDFVAAIYDNGQITRLSANNATAFNDNGQILVEGGDVLYDNGQLSSIGGMGRAINNNGQITGQVIGVTGSRAFLNSNGQMTDIGTLGGKSAGGVDINEQGQITGWTTTADSKQHAFFYSNGTMTDLDPSGKFSLSFGNAINDHGQIVGGAGGSAFLYSNGQMINIGPLGVLSMATDINNNGQVIGGSALDYDDAFYLNPFFYDKGVTVGLNSLLIDSTTWKVSHSTAISDNGQIVAVGYNFIDGKRHGMLLTPTELPVPGAVWLFSSALIGFRITGKRRKHIDCK